MQLTVSLWELGHREPTAETQRKLSDATWKCGHEVYFPRRWMSIVGRRRQESVGHAKPSALILPLDYTKAGLVLTAHWEKPCVPVESPAKLLFCLLIAFIFCSQAVLPLHVISCHLTAFSASFPSLQSFCSGLAFPNKYIHAVFFVLKSSLRQWLGKEGEL